MHNLLKIVVIKCIVSPLRCAAGRRSRLMHVEQAILEEFANTFHGIENSQRLTAKRRRLAVNQRPRLIATLSPAGVLL